MALLIFVLIYITAFAGAVALVAFLYGRRITFPVTYFGVGAFLVYAHLELVRIPIKRLEGIQIDLWHVSHFLGVKLVAPFLAVSEQLREFFVAQSFKFDMEPNFPDFLVSSTAGVLFWMAVAAIITVIKVSNDRWLKAAALRPILRHPYQLVMFLYGLPIGLVLISIPFY